jgi:thiamine-monophosphate kinase
MKVSELGEFGLIDLLAKMIDCSPGSQSFRQELVVSIGDDAAAWRSGTAIHLATVDALIQDVHFSLDTATWYDLGWKAMAVNLSDIAAMGGVPKYALVSLALPGDTDVEDVATMYRGMIELGEQFGVIIVGGNVSRSPVIMISITVMGTTGSQDKHILTRSSARPGEKVAVTGYLGSAAAGLEVLKQDLPVDPENAARLKKAFLQPYPRVAEGRILVEQGIRSAIDISDGLVSDLNHICEMSRVGARIEVDRLPIEAVVRDNFGSGAFELALSGGEDYELLFTGGAGMIEKVKKAVSCPVTVIGEIVADETEKVTLLDRQGNPFRIEKAGWEHFNSQ